MFPQHPPVVLCCLGQRALGCYVGFLLPTQIDTTYGLLYMILYLKNAIRHFEKNWGFILPISINEAGINIVRSLHSSDWLQTHTCGLIWHDVYQPVLKLVAGQIGTHKPWCVGLSAGQTLKQREKESEFLNITQTEETKYGPKSHKTQTMKLVKEGRQIKGKNNNSSTLFKCI